MDDGIKFHLQTLVENTVLDIALENKAPMITSDPKDSRWDSF